MKKLLTFLMFFLLATAMAQMQAVSWETNPTSITSLKTGDIIAIVDGGSGRAMTNNNGTASAPDATSFDPATTGLDNIEWEIVVGSNGNYQFKVPGTTNYLYCTSANNGVRVGTNGNNVFTISGNYLKNNATSRYVGVYDNADWRCYTSTGGNIGSTKTNFYKKVSAAPTVAYTVTLGDDDTKLTETKAGAGVTLPSRNNVGDWTFVGWSTSNYTDESTNVPTTIAAGSCYKPTANVTLYPMYKRTEGEDNILSQTLQYDSWTYSGSTTNKSGYRLFHSGSYIESAEFDLSKLAKVIVYGGTFGGTSYNKLTIGDGTKTWKSVTVSGSSQTGINTFTDGSSLTGTGKLRITSNSGTSSSTGVRISKVEIYISTLVEYYISTPVAPVVKTATTTAFAVETVTKTVGDADFTEAATLTPNEAGSLTYSSSNTGVATVNATTGVVHIVGVGTTIIKAEFAETDDYKASSDSYTLTVNAATLTSIAISGTPTKTEYKVGEAFSTEGLTVTGTYSNGNSAPITEGIVWTFEPATLAATTTSVTATATVNGKSASQPYTVKVSKKAASVAIENVEVEVGKFAPISATTTPADAELTYTVTEGVDKISIADGVITGVAEGTATVKATFAGNDEYNTAETTFTVTVTAAPVPGTGDFTLVTSASDLVAGREYVIVAKDATSGTTNFGNYALTLDKAGTNNNVRAAMQINTVSSDGTTVGETDGMAILTLGGEKDAWTFTSASKYLSLTSNDNYLNVQDKVDDNAKTTISFTDNKAKIVFNKYPNNSGKDRYLQLNLNIQSGSPSNPRFACYSSTQIPIYLYYREGVTPVVKTLDHIAVVEGYKADYTDGDAFEKATVMAYYVEEGVEPVNVTNKATFSGYDLSAETTGEQTVNVSYTEGEVTATTSYTINFTAVTKRTVTIVPPVNGQLKVVVKATGAEIATGARVADGTVLKITNTPGEGYVLRKLVVTDTEKHNYTAQDKEITVNGIDVTINAIFIKGDNYTYTWSVNGQVASQDHYEANQTVTAPAVTADQCPAGKTFVGWSRTATVDADNCTLATVDPTAVTDRTYFAVFATENTEPSTDGSNVYYEKVPNTYTDWLNGEYLLVYETGTNNKVNVFNAASGTNFVETTVQDNKIYATNTMATIKMVKDLQSDGETPCEWTHVMVKKVADNSYSQYIYHEGSGKTFLYITADAATNLKNTFHQSKYAISISWDTANNRWKATLNGKYIGYSTSSSDFRLNENSNTTNKAVQFYVKKGGTVTTYSEYTTGMTVDPHDFQLVTSDDDLVAGREYIIVSKFINDDNSRTIYGLSVDNADSRTENGKEGTSKTTTNFRRGETGVTFSHGDYFASIDNKISVLALEGEEGAWAFNSAAGYLKGGKETEAFLRINSNRANATISKDNLDVATIIYKVVKDDEEVDGTREVFLNINGGYPRYGAYAHNNLTDTDKKFNYAASYLYWREALNEESLAEIEANGINGTNYTVTDELVVAYVDENKNVAWAHDMAKSYAYRENTYDATWYGGYVADSYTQHNWVKLTFPEGTDMNNKVEGQQLSNVKGTYHGHKGVSHEIAVTSFDNNSASPNDVEKANEYIMASFWDDNTYDYVEAKGKKFFLMNPKIEEVCYITEAVWNGTGFVMPEAGQEFTTKNENGTDGPKIHLNTYDLKGGIHVDWKYNKTGTPTQIGEDRYKFLAVVTKKDSAPTTGGAGAGAPAKVAPSLCGLSDYVIYPLDFTVNYIVTDVKDVNVAGREVKSVRYYDVAGRSYGEAQPGINIVVTEYTDGSHSAAKMVR